MEALEKKLVQLENELAATTTNLENSNVKLEEREKALQNVSRTFMTVHDSCLLIFMFFFADLQFLTMILELLLFVPFTYFKCDAAARFVLFLHEAI